LLVDNLCDCIMLVCFVSAENIARCSHNAKHNGCIEEETAAAWSLPMAAVGDGSVTQEARSSRGPRKGFLADAPWSNGGSTASFRCRRIFRITSPCILDVRGATELRRVLLANGFPYDRHHNSDNNDCHSP
jgi:hypothetical protein